MPADYFDSASDLEEAERAALAKKRKPEATRTGFCLNENCGEVLSNSAAAYCNLECSLEGERVTAQRTRHPRLRLA